MLASLLALAVVFILIFLQPFDTYQTDMPFKNLKLLGYSVCIIMPVMFLHTFEELWYKRNKSKWFLYQEIIILFFGFILISIASFFYNAIVVNDINVEYNYILTWSLNFGLPFVPVFIPLWAYLRFRFSTVEIRPKEKNGEKVVSIAVNNQQSIQFKENDFLFAQSQANYVDVYFLDGTGLRREMIRFTISGLIDIIPSALQIHRSYLVNPSQIKEISGNTRKGNVKINHFEEEIPISPKHFTAVKNLLQSRP